MSIIAQYFNTKDFIDRQTFEYILQSSKLLMNNTCLKSLWNLCQPSDEGVSYRIFLQHFAPFKLENKQCRILNYRTRIYDIVKYYWQNIKNDFSCLDRYGRFFITIDQALNLMKKYSFPLNDQQQYELALLFSPKNNGQFNYFDFMQYFSNQSLSNQYIFSRFTYIIQSKQSWTVLPITIDGIFNRIRSQCISKYESIYKMFRVFDKNHQKYLTKIQLNQLLKEFNIHLNDEELYHILSEIDKNQDGLISYNELYDSLMTNALQI
ncbi:unnamed protein product [Adineta steineri]|uniref:EF-hand domain-containing protein n=1 Tax=Adineta steineri TaxID=433720 RepID=A0A813SC34_9BILA|nr:unnamed protein product [Adineta steineri]